MLANTGIVRNAYFEAASSFDRIKIDNNRNTKWTHELTKKEISHINAINNFLMKIFGHLHQNAEMKEINGEEKLSLKARGMQAKVI